MKLQTTFFAAAFATIAATATLAFASDDIDPALQAKITAQLTAQGYDVRKVQMEDGMIEVYAVKDGKTVTRWATGETLDIRYESEQRLRAAYECMRLLLQFDAPETVRAWFVGLNPQLDDVSPIEALRAGQLRDVVLAARAFVAGG